MLKRTICVTALAMLLPVISGCGSGDDVEVVDLNRVLDVLAKVLEEPMGPVQPQTEPAAKEVQPIAEADPAKEADFLKRFATALNEEKLVKSPVGVTMLADGSIEGFTDPNSNMTKDADEQHLFKVQIDAENSRLIASDEAGGYHRDRQYTYRPGGFFMGYMLGSMMGRQNNYYASAGQAKPNFRNMQMSDRNYHSQAVSAATARSASVRSKGGSRGFSFGK